MQLKISAKIDLDEKGMGCYVLGKHIPESPADR